MPSSNGFYNAAMFKNIFVVARYWVLADDVCPFENASCVWKLRSPFDLYAFHKLCIHGDYKLPENLSVILGGDNQLCAF